MVDGLVTVVVPIYKTEKYLDRCITSIVNQTYSNLEILLIDDGSPDRCPTMCDEWAERESRVRVIHKENAGLGMARNSGIDNASGEFICFLDSDDYFDLRLIEKAYKLAKENSADLVTFGFTYVDENGMVIGTGIPKHSMEGVSSCTRLFSLQMLKNKHIRYPSERELISEDFYAKLLWEIHVKNPICLPEPLYYYCRNYHSLSRVFRADKYEKGIRFYEVCMDLLVQQNRVEEKSEEILEWFISNTIAAMKETVETDRLTIGQKWKMIRGVVNDAFIQNAVSKKDLARENNKRKLFYWAINRKAYLVVYVLIWLQNQNRNKWR